MQPTSVLIKTAKGLEEIDKRTCKLAGRLRALLFMVDGQRTFGELLEQAGNMAAPLQAQLSDLAQQGFIREAGGDAQKLGVASPAALPAPSTAPVLPPASMAELKVRLSKLAADSLGMRAMFVNAQIDAVVRHSDLADVINDIARSIALSMVRFVAEQWRSPARTLVEISP